MKRVILVKNKISNIYKKHEEIINYIIAGGLTTVVSIGSKWLLLFTIFDAKNPTQLQAAIIISWICAVLFAYVVNRIFVFKSKDKNIIKELIKFVGSRVTTLLLEMFIMWLFVTFLKLNSDTWVVVWTIFAQILIMIFNYILSKLFIFKKTQ